MYIRTYADKSNTIVKGSSANLSLNPVMELNYGNMLTRGLIHFPHDRVQSLINDGTFADTTKLRHTLKMTNAASVNDRRINCMMDDSNSSYKTPEAATQEFLLRTISPLIREMEDEYNSKLLGAEDFGKRRIHICEKALRRLDPTAQANLFKTYLETGAYTVNEIRGEMDMPSVEDGDKNYISTNLAELGSEKLSGKSKSDGGKDSRIEQETVTTSPWMGAAVIQQHTGREYGMEADENGTRTEGAVIQRHTGREKTGEKREGGEG